MSFRASSRHGSLWHRTMYLVRPVVVYPDGATRLRVCLRAALPLPPPALLLRPRREPELSQRRGAATRRTLILIRPRLFWQTLLLVSGLGANPLVLKTHLLPLQILHNIRLLIQLLYHRQPLTQLSIRLPVVLLPRPLRLVPRLLPLWSVLLSRLISPVRLLVLPLLLI